jgi:NADH:ubiquinone oxidoreductase subunit 3 (subunit A)
MLIAGVCALGVIWLVPWATHLTEATLLDLLIGIVFIGAMSFCALGE